MSEKFDARILQAIGKQRWFYFRNKSGILLDKTTGLLWGNVSKGLLEKYEAIQFVKDFYGGGYSGWRIPFGDEFDLIRNNFPFTMSRESYCFCQDAYGSVISKHVRLQNVTSRTDRGYVIPCNDVLIKGTNYREARELVLQLFIYNGLIPIFDNYSYITELYEKLYSASIKPVKSMKPVKLDEPEILHSGLSSEFDYASLLGDYDLPEIAKSPIKYYKAIQEWTSELMLKLDVFDREKEKTIQDFNEISLQLSGKYEDDPNFAPEENDLLRSRREFFGRNFSLVLNDARKKILNFKRQAEELDTRLNALHDSSDLLVKLAEFESEKLPTFEFVAEDTAEIICSALEKLEYFEANRDFVKYAIEMFSQWSEDYRVFRLMRREEFRKLCEEDGIESEIWESWYSEWQKIRLKIELKILPIIEYKLKNDFAAEKFIEILDKYKRAIDKFFIEERKGIYQEFEQDEAGDLQEKWKLVSKLYGLTLEFQNDLLEIIFSSDDFESRLFMLNCAGDLLDMPIDNIMEYVKDRELDEISANLFEKFSQLKLKNYEIFLSDAKAYSMAQSDRKKQFNSLLSRMRKDFGK